MFSLEGTGPLESTGTPVIAWWAPEARGNRPAATHATALFSNMLERIDRVSKHALLTSGRLFQRKAKEARKRLENQEMATLVSRDSSL